MINDDLLSQVIERARQTQEADFSSEKIQFISNLSRLSARNLQLHKLDFQHNELVELDNLPPIVTLECLDVSYNHLTEVRASLPFPRLKVFAARCNRISHVTSTFPAGIEVIDLYDNNIKDNSDISSCDGAKILNVEANPISAKPAAFETVMSTSGPEVLLPTRAPPVQSFTIDRQVGELSGRSVPELPDRSIRELPSGTPETNRAYEELIALYERQLSAKNQIGFPGPTRPVDMPLLRRSLFELLYDKQSESRQASALQKQMSAQQQQLESQQKREEILQKELQRAETEAAHLYSENEELRAELNLQFERESATKKIVMGVQAQFDDLIGCIAEFQEDVEDAVTAVRNKLARCENLVKGFKMPNKEVRSCGVESTDVEFTVEHGEEAATEASAVPNPQVYTETEYNTANRGFETDESDFCTKSVETEELAVKVEPRSPQLPSKLVKIVEQEKPPSLVIEPYRITKSKGTPEFNSENPLLMSPNQFSRFIQSVRAPELRASDLAATSVTQIARKYEHVSEERVENGLDEKLRRSDRLYQPAGPRLRETPQIGSSASHEPVQIRFFGVRPESFVAEQLADLDLE